jgi:hypothetical protein
VEGVRRYARGLLGVWCAGGFCWRRKWCSARACSACDALRVLSIAENCSVVVREQDGRDRPLALAADGVGDYPDLAVVSGDVAGEETTVTAAGRIVVGGLVVVTEVSPVADSMTIEQGGDEAMGHGSSH